MCKVDLTYQILMIINRIEVIVSDNLKRPQTGLINCVKQPTQIVNVLCATHASVAGCIFDILG